MMNLINDAQDIYTVDISIIAIVFDQLAINRQNIWTELSTDWEHKEEYLGNLNVLERVLKKG